MIVALAGIAALFIWPAALAADETTSANLVQSTDVTSDGDGVGVDQRVRRADGQLPPAMTELEVVFPRGTRLNTAAFPRCSLAKLQAKGPAGCAPRSQVGAGIARAQVPFRFPHEFAATVRVFNGTGIARFASKRSLLIYIRPQAGAAFVSVGRWSGSRRTGRRLTIQFPKLGYPEAVPDALVRLAFNLGARRGAASFLRAPCPGTYRAAARYFDGSVVTSRDRARCT